MVPSNVSCVDIEIDNPVLIALRKKGIDEISKSPSNVRQLWRDYHPIKIFIFQLIFIEY